MHFKGFGEQRGLWCRARGRRPAKYKIPVGRHVPFSESDREAAVTLLGRVDGVAWTFKHRQGKPGIQGYVDADGVDRPLIRMQHGRGDPGCIGDLIGVHRPARAVESWNRILPVHGISRDEPWRHHHGIT